MDEDCKALSLVVPAKAVTHAPCAIDRLRSMGPGPRYRSPGTTVGPQRFVACLPFARFTLPCFSSTAQTAAVSCSP